MNITIFHENDVKSLPVPFAGLVSTRLLTSPIREKSLYRVGWGVAVQAVQVRGLHELSARHPPATLGRHAAPLRALTDQVPMRVVFLTDGPSRTVNLGGREITLKRATPRRMALAGRISGTVSQALRWMGKEHVSDETVAALRERLSDVDRQSLIADIRYVPAWVGEVFRAIA